MDEIHVEVRQIDLQRGRSQREQWMRLAGNGYDAEYYLS